LDDLIFSGVGFLRLCMFVLFFGFDCLVFHNSCSEIELGERTLLISHLGFLRFTEPVLTVLTVISSSIALPLFC